MICWWLKAIYKLHLWQCILQSEEFYVVIVTTNPNKIFVELCQATLWSSMQQNIQDVLGNIYKSCVGHSCLYTGAVIANYCCI